MADNIAQWLDGLGLGQYAQSFVDHDIGLAVLPRLTEDDLKDLGLSLPGHRRTLQAALERLSADASSDGGSQRRELSETDPARTGAAERADLGAVLDDLQGDGPGPAADRHGVRRRPAGQADVDGGTNHDYQPRTLRSRVGNRRPRRRGICARDRHGGGGADRPARPDGDGCRKDRPAAREAPQPEQAGQERGQGQDRGNHAAA